MTQLLLDKNDNYEDKLNSEYEDQIKDIDISQKNLLDYMRTQNQKIENIEYNMDKIDNYTLQSNNNLITCSKYNISYKTVIIGGIVGSIFISPFGYLLGVKAGSLISLSGMVFGSYASYKLQSV